MSGAFVISLDLELYWGWRDLRALDACRDKLMAGRAVVPRLLEVFSRHDIHATWATVGFLFCETKDELLESLPDVRPTYQDPRLSPYAHIAEIGPDEERDPLHYAPSLIRQIGALPTQEIASHTFSHYYCLEPGQDAAAFQADMAASTAVAQKRGVTLESLVFPRSQVNRAYLPLCRALGIRTYRGVERSPLHRAGPQVTRTQLRRWLRLLDAYAPVTSRNAYPVEPNRGGIPLEIPASRFLRPYNPRRAWLEPLRLRRVLDDMEHAARRGLVYHLWWHPEDFGTHTERNFAVLERILDRFSMLRERYGIRSVAMRDLAATSEGRAAAGASVGKRTSRIQRSAVSEDPLERNRT